MTSDKIDELLRDADGAWNVGTLAIAFMAIQKANPTMTLLDIEDRMRAIGSKTTYLVAWPKHLLPATPVPGHRHVPRDGAGKKMKYGLWICINGPEDMLNQVQEFGLTVEQNREALRKAGFLMIEPW